MNLQTGNSYTRWLTNGTLFYLLFPFLLFLAGWIRPIYAVPACLVLIGCAYEFISQARNDVLAVPPVAYRIGVFLLAVYWCWIAGLGEWMPQSTDFFKHDLIFSDLVRFDWPVRYSLPGKPFLCYYLAYYLPIAVVGKVMGLQFVPIASFLWSLGGLSLIFNWILVIGSRYRIGALVGFTLLSGMNVIRFLIASIIKLFSTFHLYDLFKSLPPTVYYPYSIKYWDYIPQQVLGAWLIMGWIYVELFQRKRYSSIFFVASLGLFYSPFAVFGLAPLILSGWPSSWRQFLSIPNIAGATIVFFFLSAYYSAHYPINASGWNIPLSPLKMAHLVNTLATDVLIPFLIVRLLHQRYKVLNRQQMNFINVASVMKFLLAFYFVGYNNDLLMNATISISSLFFIFMGIALQQASEIPAIRPAMGFITALLIILSCLPFYLQVQWAVSYTEIRQYAKVAPTLAKLSGHSINDLNRLMKYRFMPNKYYDFSRQYLGDPNHFYNRYVLK